MPYCHPGGVHLIIGGLRERLGVVRRGRGKTVCGRGAWLALLCGPPTSPLGSLKVGAMIKKVGPANILGKHRATCHCGAVVLELSLPDGIVNPCRCNCSICRRKGAIVASVPLSGLRVVEGAELLTLYQFNTMTAKHYFCSKCGIYTHHIRRSNPNQYSYNVGCLEGVDPFDLGEVPIHDGVYHPADRRAP
jgi:hypothetical protein